MSSCCTYLSALLSSMRCRSQRIIDTKCEKEDLSLQKTKTSSPAFTNWVQTNTRSLGKPHLFYLPHTLFILLTLSLIFLYKKHPCNQSSSNKPKLLKHLRARQYWHQRHLQVLSGSSYKINIATKLKIFGIQRAMVWFIDSIPILIQRRLNLNPTRTRSHNLLDTSQHSLFPTHGEEQSKVTMDYLICYLKDCHIKF